MFRDKILQTIRKYNLLSSLDRVLVGVSGGPDSVALLYLLYDLKVKLGIKIIVAHLNHGLRGKASDLDEEFVKNISSSLGLDCVSRKIRWTSTKSKPSEEALRKLRYDFLFSVAKKYKIDKIALAHTLDDQAETVLMRFIRGTGLYGLISILPKRREGAFDIIRPMIETSRSQIEDYLKKIKVRPRIDKTNFSKIFLRNKLRHGLLKDLSRMNPNIKPTLARFAQQAAADYDYLYQQAKHYVKGNGDSVKLDLLKLGNLHLALQRMAIRVALERIAQDLRSFTYKHWEETQDLINKRPNGSIVHLTKDICAKKDKYNIVIYKK
ncbi:MAG: tRNA lysidine(34) synthetase TilS [Candidatus Omnitrophica bacterium]|nr:tRNA lysidine(34) synthetase TilS [Candidatus Omnitrophota bacterium]MDD5352566.1 tRNA lysidine(34) synthetase TilS [Candidatus Omnitrophota bacterium]MDD5550164.1 tRNA lysidine(34) synthetase TilS [Candidatus Omnitrophota bacterium]